MKAVILRRRLDTFDRPPEEGTKLELVIPVIASYLKEPMFRRYEDGFNRVGCYSPRYNYHGDPETPEWIHYKVTELYFVKTYDPTTANVFADWLDDAGEPAAAEKLRKAFPLTEDDDGDKNPA